MNRTIENIEKIKITVNRNRRITNAIIIPMLFVVILSLGLVIGVLSCYIMKLPSVRMECQTNLYDYSNYRGMYGKLISI